MYVISITKDNHALFAFNVYKGIANLSCLFVLPLYCCDIKECYNVLRHIHLQ